MSTPNENERYYDSTESSDKMSDDALSQDELDNVAGGIRAAGSDKAAAGADKAALGSDAAAARSSESDDRNVSRY